MSVPLEEMPFCCRNRGQPGASFSAGIHASPERFYT
jgi:hypothetical protein